MIIHSYAITNPDEKPVLPDALDSMAQFSDHIYLVDGGLGGGTLNQNPTHAMPIREWLGGDTFWNGVPLTLWENGFTTPGAQRNWILNKMLQEPQQPDWIAWCDSDEIFSNEFIQEVRPFLGGLSPDITNVCPKWLTLIQDEQHYAPAHSRFLSHARLHHPGVVSWTEQWHEHQHYVGRRISWDAYVIHTRMLFRRRLYVQRGHKVINEGAWADVTDEPVPVDVTWNLHWPDGEPVGMPFNADIREYEGGRWATI